MLQKEKSTSVDSSSDKPKSRIRNVASHPLSIKQTEVQKLEVEQHLDFIQVMFCSKYKHFKWKLIIVLTGNTEFYLYFQPFFLYLSGHAFQMYMKNTREPQTLSTR